MKIQDLKDCLDLIQNYPEKEHPYLYKYAEKIGRKSLPNFNIEKFEKYAQKINLNYDNSRRR